MVLVAGFVAPFASFLDGFYSLVLWTTQSAIIPLLLVPMFFVGMVAGLLRTRFLNLFMAQRLSGALSPETK